MAIHGLLLREAVKAFGRYYRLEGRAFDKLYQGFPRSRTIGRGVRHGLTAGSVIGSALDTPGNELPKKKPRFVNTPRQPYKTRGGRTGRSRAQRSKYVRPDSRGRCPRPRQYY